MLVENKSGVVNPASTLSKYSQAQVERLLFIDFKLYFLGRVNRTQIVERFGIKEAAGSRDLTLYKTLAPNNLDYSTTKRAYFKTNKFIQLFNHTESQALFALVKGFGDDVTLPIKSLITCEAPTQLNSPNIDALAAITRAIYNHQILSIQYQSLSSGLTHRDIVPFALVDNGLRWHVRAFDRKENRFADFVINRMDVKQAHEDKDIPESQTKLADNQWNRIVDLHIVPHPNLKHPETIKKEYCMKKRHVKGTN